MPVPPASVHVEQSMYLHKTRLCDTGKDLDSNKEKSNILGK